MGKKIPKVMEEQKEKLLSGLIEHGMGEQKAQKLWSLFEPFAAYGFNKAHAASYGLVSYQTAYMKANFPPEYMSAVLTADSGDVEKISEIITECKRMGFEVLPPDVNESYSDFTVVRDDKGEITNKIRFGLRSIKNFGEEIGSVIIRERLDNGVFESFAEFLERIQHRNLNKKSLESLIMSGAMDGFGERGMLLTNLEDALTYNRSFTSQAAGQESLFGLMSDSSSVPTFTLKNAPPADMRTMLRWEKELLGLYVSGHPLEEHREKFKNNNINTEIVKTFASSTPVILAGMLDEVKEITTKKGAKMAFAKLSDFDGSIELVAFSKPFENFRDLLVPDTCVVVRGTVSHRNGEPSVLIERMKLLEDSNTV